MEKEKNITTKKIIFWAMFPILVPFLIWISIGYYLLEVLPEKIDKKFFKNINS